MAAGARYDGGPSIRVSTTLPRLHAITDNNILALADLTDRAKAIGRSPNVALHARAQGAPGRRLTESAALLLDAASATGARLFVNDRADVALLVDAHGVHLPAGGLAVSKVRNLIGPDRWIGRSTHSPADALRASEEGADYVFLGPIWETPSHPGRPAIGLDAIERAQPARIIAIGGVTTGRAEACLDAGAYGIAAISSLWLAPDPGAVAAEMLLLLRNM